MTVVDSSVTVSYIDHLIKLEFACKRNSSSGTKFGDAVNYFSTSDYIFPQFKTNGLVINITANTLTQYTIIAEYTKTTD